MLTTADKVLQSKQQIVIRLRLDDLANTSLETFNFVLFQYKLKVSGFLVRSRWWWVQINPLSFHLSTK